MNSQTIAPDTDEEIVQMLLKDKTTLGKIFLKLQRLNWNEKMAVGLAAYHQLDKTSSQLIEIKPRYGEFEAPVAEVMNLLADLSPLALAELAADIVQNDFDIEK